MNRRYVVVRASHPRLSMRISTRGMLVCTVLLLVLLATAVVTTAYGDTGIPLWHVLRAVIGKGSEFDQLIVRTLRLPRICEGILVGGGLALAGGIFQSVAGNGLVAPDIIGINTGAAVVAVSLILAGWSIGDIPVFAFAGAIVAAAVVYLAAIQRGRIVPYRLVLVGISVNATLAAVLTFLLTRSYDTSQFVTAQRWLIGTLENATWTQVRVLAIVALFLLPTTLVLGHHLEVLQLGDDAARSLGLGVERTRLALVVVGVGLAATAVSYAGPVGFIAFVAPHIARRLVRGASTISLLASFLVGAILLTSADYVGQHVIEPSQLPVGILTTLLGAPYFLLLLYRSGKGGDTL